MGAEYAVPPGVHNREWKESEKKNKQVHTLLLVGVTERGRARYGVRMAEGCLV